jgi:hypothetical protein
MFLHRVFIIILQDRMLEVAIDGSELVTDKELVADTDSL